MREKERGRDGSSTYLPLLSRKQLLAEEILDVPTPDLEDRSVTFLWITSFAMDVVLGRFCAMVVLDDEEEKI
ncbi:unnamed protein product [Thelazia callipaeda]|uniref:Uncharacterized protein n=1 Tax=Thelazia callipaeda TaxID=103827 RepID=A0A0N5CUI5_THECL|nr:unnamed protein product [Thelazia callipaeda]